MLRAIRDFFEQHLASSDGAPAPERALELATATLVAEVARLDGGIDAAERAAVVDAIRDHFGIDDAEARTLVELAEDEAREATDYYQFTSLIRERYSQEQRQQIVEMLWRAAYADARISAHEHHVIRKVADLLYVPHASYIAAKMRAKEAAGDAGREGDRV
jgi:uncharacterized tellurite resistance protein B-like protein